MGLTSYSFSHNLILCILTSSMWTNEIRVALGNDVILVALETDVKYGHWTHWKDTDSAPRFECS